MNRYLEDLINFIKEVDNWKEVLLKAPYNLKNIKECNWHPNWFMFNYNLFNSDFTIPLVKACRGTVLEIVGKEVKPICIPYYKFFNAGDPNADEIDWNSAEVYDKIDGILIKAFKYDNKLYWTTNGSFDMNAPFEDSLVFDEPETRNSECYGDLLSYAIKKEDNDVEIHFNKETGEFYTVGGWCDNYENGSTFMFELTSPRNKIICKYNETKLWWHGFRNGADDEQLPAFIRSLNASKPSYTIPNKYNLKDMESVKKLLSDFKGIENEGVVVVDNNFHRIKIKCEDYLKIKFANDMAANKNILFKAILNNEEDDLISAVPALLPISEEIKKEISLFKDWYIAESFRVKGTKKEWVEYCKSNIDPRLFSFYMDMYIPNNLAKLNNKLLSLSCRKHGYKQFKDFLECIQKK